MSYLLKCDKAGDGLKGTFFQHTTNLMEKFRADVLKTAQFQLMLCRIEFLYKSSYIPV